jgi:hypothetical protein
MSENTAGFYMYEEPTLNYAPNFVLSANYELRKETKNDHEYPIYGWYWFDSEDEAKSFFKITD